MRWVMGCLDGRKLAIASEFGLGLILIGTRDLT